MVLTRRSPSLNKRSSGELGSEWSGFRRRKQTRTKHGDRPLKQYERVIYGFLKRLETEWNNLSSRSWLTLVLVGVHLIVLWEPSSLPSLALSTACQSGGLFYSLLHDYACTPSSVPLPRDYVVPLSNLTPQRDQRFPSVEERVQFYMGRWNEPKNVSSPIALPNWDSRNQALEEQRRSVSQWHPSRRSREPVLNPWDMNPKALLWCSRGGGEGKATHATTDESKKACQDRLVQLKLKEIVDAAIIVQEFREQSVWNYFWQVWWYEGALGWLMEWPRWFQRQINWVLGNAHTQPAYLWSLSYNETVASLQWTTEVPVFSSIRNLNAENDWEHFRLRRSPHSCNEAENPYAAACRSVHSTILWPLGQSSIQATAASVPTLDIPWANKKEQATYLRQTLEDTLKYRFLVATNRNDMRELTWMLFSNSVVMMPADYHYLSWLMETKLEPYVHFIPVNHNLSNIDDQLSWAANNTDATKEIASRSSLFVYDLLFHRSAAKDNEKIMRIILHRYNQFVLGKKPIVKATVLWERLLNHWTLWVRWFLEDWLRIAFLVVVFLFLWF